MEPFLDILHTHQTALIEKPYGSTQDFTYINQIYDLENKNGLLIIKSLQLILNLYMPQYLS